jgi:hypothetical protein
MGEAADLTEGSMSLAGGEARPGKKKKLAANESFYLGPWPIHPSQAIAGCQKNFTQVV